MMQEILPILKVILIDISLSGDNAVVIAMAVMGLPVEKRKKAIFFGTMFAIALRIVFSVGAVWLLHVPYLPIFAGLGLLWVSWKMFQEIRGSNDSDEAKVIQAGMAVAICQIVIADISMSIDNVLAVATAARDHLTALIIGLIASIAFMAIAANLITKILSRFPILKYLGLALILYVAVDILVRSVPPDLVSRIFS